MEDPPDAMSANVVRLEELGHGATGCVYKAVHATSLQLLAVKEVGVVLVVVFWGACGSLLPCVHRGAYCDRLPGVVAVLLFSLAVFPSLAPSLLSLSPWICLPVFTSSIYYCLFACNHTCVRASLTMYLVYRCARYLVRVRIRLVSTSLVRLYVRLLVDSSFLEIVSNSIPARDLSNILDQCVTVDLKNWPVSSATQVPVHDKTRRDQIGAELWLLKRCRADAAARFEEEEAKRGTGETDSVNRGGDEWYRYPGRHWIGISETTLLEMSFIRSYSQLTFFNLLRSWVSTVQSVVLTAHVF